jgi:MFS family permease
LFLLNAVSFVPVVSALAAMRTPELIRQRPLARSKGQVREGLRYVWNTPALRSTLLLLSVVATFGFNQIIVLPLLARYVFHGGPGLYGTLFAALAAGGFIGGLAAAGRARPSRRVLIGAATGFSVLAMLVSLAPTAAWAIVGLVPMGLCSMTFIATANSTLQLNARHEMRGRVMALYALVFLGSTPIGGPIVGWISQQWGARSGLFVGGAASLVAAGAAAWSAHRQGPREEAADDDDEVLPLAAVEPALEEVSA